MVFKALVEAIIKSKRNPDDSLALNTVNTLNRELRNDLIQAYDLSQPLIDKNVSLFFESNSFLDFLLKLNHLPTALDYKTNEDAQSGDSSGLENRLRVCQESKRNLNDELNDLKQKYQKSKRALDECNEEKNSLKNQLDQKVQELLSSTKKTSELTGKLSDLETEKDVLSKRYERQLTDLEKELEGYKREINLFKSSEQRYMEEKDSRRHVKYFQSKSIYQPISPNTTFQTFAAPLSMNDQPIQSFSVPQPTISMSEPPFQSNPNSLPYVSTPGSPSSRARDEQTEQMQTSQNPDYAESCEQSAINELTTRVSDLEKEISVQKNLNENCDKEKSKLNDNLAKLKNELDDCLQKTKNLESEKEKCIASQNKLQSEYDDMKIQYQTREKILENETDRCKNLQEEIKNYESREKDYKEKIRELELAQTENKSVNNTSLMESLGTLTDNLNQLNKEKSELKKSKAKLEKEISKLNERLEESNKQLEQLKTENEKLQKNLEECEARHLEEIGKLKNEICKHQNSPEKLKSSKTRSETDVKKRHHRNREKLTQAYQMGLKNVLSLQKDSKVDQTDEKMNTDESENPDLMYVNDAFQQGHTVVEYLYEKFKNNPDWENSFIREYEKLTESLEKAEKQCKILQTRGDRVNVTIENFADNVMEMIDNNPNYLAKLDEIAKSASLPNDDDLPFKLGKMSTDFHKIKNDVEQLGHGLTVENFSEKITDTFAFLKRIAAFFDSKFSVDDDNWLVNFKGWFPDYEENMKNYFSSLTEAFTYLESIYNEAIKTNESLKEKTFENFALIQKLEKLHEYEAIWNELSNFTSDMKLWNDDEWKNLFVERYKILWHFASYFFSFDSSHFTDPNYVRKSLENVYAYLKAQASSLNPEFSEQKQWLITFVYDIINFVRDLRSKYPLQGSFNEWKHKILNDTSVECTVPKVDVTKFQMKKIPPSCKKDKRDLPYKSLTKNLKPGTKFKYNTSYKDTKSSKFMKYSKLVERLETYFDIENMTFDSLVFKIDEVLNDQITKFKISGPVECHEDDKSSFEEHLEIYFALILNRFSSQEDDLSKFDSLYEEWLRILKFDSNLNKENFAEKLKDVTRKKRVCITHPLDSDPGNYEKRFRLSESWSAIEIQNIFLMLYQAYFKLKWNNLQNEIPNSEEIRQELVRKLEILEGLNARDRENLLFEVFEKYVRSDLETIVGSKETLSYDVLPLNTLLKECMDSTEKYLMELFNKKCDDIDDDECDIDDDILEEENDMV